MSSRKGHENPYREGDYREMFGFWMSKQIVTRQEFIEHTVKDLGLDIKRAMFNVNVLLSPRKSSKRGDCRGNLSARGDLHYSEKLPRAVRFGIKEPQRFRLRWREVPLERKTRKNIGVSQVKVPVTSTVVAKVKASKSTNKEVKVG